MKERPILFSGPMVRAILEGHKTQTRRVIKPSLGGLAGLGFWGYDTTAGDGATTVMFGDQLGYTKVRVRCPYGQPGDRLWVRETWHPHGVGRAPNWTSDLVIYRADNEGLQPFDGCSSQPLPAPVQWHGKQTANWRPSIHMPRWASRITLDIMDVWIERLQDIGSAAARTEGVDAPDALLRSKFATLWDSINAKRGYGWDSDPWVWVIAFKRVQP